MPDYNTWRYGKVRTEKMRKTSEKTWNSKYFSSGHSDLIIN